MFSVVLKCIIDTLLKWFYNIYKLRFVETNTLTKQKYEKKNHPIDWSLTKCVICDFRITVGLRLILIAKKLPFKILYLRNIYNKDDLKNSDAIKDAETYYKNLKRFIKCSLVLHKYCNRNCEIDNLDHNCMETFINNDLKRYETFGEL